METPDILSFSEGIEINSKPLSDLDPNAIDPSLFPLGLFESVIIGQSYWSKMEEENPEKTLILILLFKLFPFLWSSQPNLAHSSIEFVEYIGFTWGGFWQKWLAGNSFLPGLFLPQWPIAHCHSLQVQWVHCILKKASVCPQSRSRPPLQSLLNESFFLENPKNAQFPIDHFRFSRNPRFSQGLSKCKESLFLLHE